MIRDKNSFSTMRSRNTRSILTFAWLSLVALSSCAVRSRSTAPSTPNLSMMERGYVDLQPAWRIRVVTPVTKAGRFDVAAESVETNGRMLALKTSDDFIGYEVAYYSVIARQGGGIAFQFKSATVTKNGVASRQTRPLVRLFELPPDARFVRLLFLARVIPAEHNQGIVAAATLQQLQTLTEQVLADPVHNCRSDRGTFCEWVPLGIAVQPEQKRENKTEDWTPVT